MKEAFLIKRLGERKDQNAYRRLRLPDGKVDFCSNDYLGIVKNRLNEGNRPSLRSGSTGSRLLAGNSALAEELEKELAIFHDAPAGLIFNSGYDANTGLLSSVTQKGDTVLYDALSHASLRDGLRLSFARSFSFRHNDPDDLEKKLGTAAKSSSGNLFVITESVFSMDGDLAPLTGMAALCERYGALLIVDEAHATGIVGEKGAGLVQELHLQHRCFARVHTFGKAVGAHGAIILGSGDLRDYLINFSRPFIYTTALPDISLAAIQASYRLFPEMRGERQRLKDLIAVFQAAELPFPVLKSSTPIQGIIVPGNNAVKKLAECLQEEGLDLRPILYPTVPAGSERLRIVLHAFNTVEEVQKLIQKIAYFYPRL